MRYIRVKDPDTGHEYDVPDNSILLAKSLVRRVKAERYPPSEYPRRTKHHKRLSAPAERNTKTTEE